MSGNPIVSPVTIRKGPFVTGAPKSDLAAQLDELVKPHGSGKTLAAFLKARKGPTEARKAFTEMTHHVNANKALYKPHILGKLAPILADFLGEINPPEVRFDLLNQLLTDHALQELGQLALGQLLENPEQLKQLKLLKKANPSFAFDKTVGDRKGAFGAIMSRVQVPFNDSSGVPVKNREGGLTTRSLGHDLLLKLNDFAKTADPDGKLFAEQLVSMLFDESGLSRCLETVDLKVPGAFKQFLELGKGEHSPAVIVLKLQAEQMSTSDEIQMVVNNLKGPEGKRCTLDHKGGPIEAFLTKALSAKGQIDYGQIVEVALLCSELRQVPIFDHILAVSSRDNGALLSAHSKGIHAAIQRLLKSDLYQDVQDRLAALDDTMSPLGALLGADVTTFDPKTTDKLVEESSRFSRLTKGRSTVPDMERYWVSGGGVMSLSRDIEGLCRKGPAGETVYVRGIVDRLVHKHIHDRLKLIEALRRPGSFTVQQLEDRRVELAEERKGLKPSSLSKECFEGVSIEDSLKPSYDSDISEKKLKDLCENSQVLIGVQLEIIDAKLKALYMGPQSSDFSGVLDREIYGDSFTWKMLFDERIKSYETDVDTLARDAQPSRDNSRVLKKLPILRACLDGLKTLKNMLEMSNRGEDPLAYIETLRAKLTSLDPKTVFYKTTLIDHEGIDIFLGEIEYAVLDQIRSNREGVVGFEPDSVPNFKQSSVLGILVSQMASNKMAVVPHVSKPMRDYYKGREEKSAKIIDFLSRDNKIVTEADRAIAGAVSKMATPSKTPKVLQEAIKDEFFSKHNGFMIMRVDPSEAEARIKDFVENKSGERDTDVKAALTVALKKLVLQFSATGQVDLQQDAMLEQLDKKTHYKNAVLSDTLAPLFWEKIDELDVQFSSSIGSSVAIQMFHNSLVMKGFTGLQTVEEWVDKGLSKAKDLPRLHAELKAFMYELSPRLDKLVVSLETVNDVRVLRNLLAKLEPKSPHIDTLTTLLDACTIDYSETRPGLSLVGLIRSASLNTEEKVVRLNDIRMRYESLVHLHKQMRGLVALNNNAKVGKFGPKELADLERELDGLGKALGLPSKELNPLDIPDYADGRTGWDTLDGLMTRLDTLVGVSEGVTNPGVRLVEELAKAPEKVTGELSSVFKAAETRFTASSAKFDSSWGSPFSFSQVPLTEQAKSFEALFKLKSEIADLGLLLTDPPATNQAGMVQSYKEKVADFQLLVLELNQLPHQESNVSSFGMMRAAYNDPKRLAAFKACPHLMGAMHASMAQSSIETFGKISEADLKNPAIVRALVKHGILKSDGDSSLKDDFKAVLQSSIENAPLSAAKGLLKSFNGKIKALNDGSSDKKGMRGVYDACIAKLNARVSDEVVKVERQLILQGSLRARGALLGESCQADVINRLVALENRNEVFQSETDAVVFATVDKMATQIMDSWVRAGQSTMFQEPIPFELSLQGHGDGQKAMAERLASGLYEMFTDNDGVPLAGMNVVLTGDKLTISFKPGVLLATRESLVEQMRDHKASLVGVSRENFDSSKTASEDYQAKVKVFAAANPQVALKDLLGKIVANNDPQQKQGLMEYLKSNPLTSARALELRGAIITFAKDPAKSAIMDSNYFSPDQWQVIFQALTPVDDASGKDYSAGYDNVLEVLNALGSSDAQAAFLKQFLPKKEVGAAFAVTLPKLDLMAAKLLAATMVVPKTVEDLKALLTNTNELSAILFNAIASRVLADKQALNTLFMGDKNIPNGLGKDEWEAILTTLDQTEFKAFFNDKWTQAMRVQLATVLGVEPGEVFQKIQDPASGYLKVDFGAESIDESQDPEDSEDPGYLKIFPGQGPGEGEGEHDATVSYAPTTPPASPHASFRSRRSVGLAQDAAAATTPEVLYDNPQYVNDQAGGVSLETVYDAPNPIYDFAEDSHLYASPLQGNSGYTDIATPGYVDDFGVIPANFRTHRDLPQGGGGKLMNFGRLVLGDFVLDNNLEKGLFEDLIRLFNVQKFTNTNTSFQVLQKVKTLEGLSGYSGETITKLFIEFSKEVPSGQVAYFSGFLFKKLEELLPDSTPRVKPGKLAADQNLIDSDIKACLPRDISENDQFKRFVWVVFLQDLNDGGKNCYMHLISFLDKETEIEGEKHDFFNNFSRAEFNGLVDQFVWGAALTNDLATVLKSSLKMLFEGFLSDNPYQNPPRSSLREYVKGLFDSLESEPTYEAPQAVNQVSPERPRSVPVLQGERALYAAHYARIPSPPRQ